MPRWTIQYSDHKVTGNSEYEWMSAPDNDVQAVVIHEPHPDGYRPNAGFNNSQGLTGEDEYSIFGWKTKYGKWMDYDKYMQLWEDLKDG